MSRTVSDVIVATLAEAGVTQIFGIVGDALNALTESVRRDGRIEWIGVRHEEGAALAAAGQAKLTGRLAACAGTTGPGGAHLVAGLYEARKDHAPVVAISGQVAFAKAGTDTMQEHNPALLFQDVSLYNQSLDSPAMAAHVAHQACAHALMGRGVAHVTVPQDVLGRPAAAGADAPFSAATLRQRPEVAPEPRDLDAAAALIDEAGTVALFAGEGARGAEAELLALADRVKAPVAHTFRAKDLFAGDDPRVAGGVGLIGGKPGIEAIQEAELLVMVGTDYPWTEYLPTHGRVVQIDERGVALGRRCPVRLGVLGSARPALAGLVGRVAAKADDGFRARVMRERRAWDGQLARLAAPDRSRDRLHPQALAAALSAAAAEDAVFVIDVGTVTLWAGNWLRQTGSRRFLCSFNNASVGTALGQAVGVQALDRGRQVVAVCGDGGFGMLMQEFMTAVQHDLPVKVVVFNNERWGLVYLEMEAAGLPAFRHGAEFRNPDFAAFAESCGGKGFRVDRPDRLGAAVAEALAAPGPVVVDAHVWPAELPVMPHVGLEKAYKFGMAKVKEAALALAGGNRA